MFGNIKKSLIVALAAGALAFYARAASADTITIQDAQVGQPQATSGIFTYTVTLDSAAIVHPNDGFVIYDFSDETSFVMAGNPGFSLSSQPLTGAGALNNNFPGSVDIAAGNAVESTTVTNLVFLYSGSVLTGAHSYLLTVNTSDKALPTSTSFGVGVDSSGPFGDSGSIESLTVPNFGSVPLPSSALSGGALLGLVLLGQSIRTRRCNA